jgi:hypothetical protein
MNTNKVDEILKNTEPLRKQEQQAVINAGNRIITKMIDTANRESDRIEHHLLEMPLPVITYQWVILRLKSRPWRLLIPASVALTLLLQSLLSRFNLLQFLAH